jgi:carbamoyl-phosphate synthase large subunit
MEKNGVSMDIILKVHEGNPNILDRLRKNEVELVINTPTSKTRSRHDGSRIRRAAVDNNVPYITTVEGSRAAATAIRSAQEKKFTIRKIQDY